MATSSRRLFLFDIDGTLITSGGAGESALKAAVADRFGKTEDLSDITIAGATDSAISRRLLEKHGIEQTPENISALLDAYLGHLGDRLPKHSGCVLPGIVQLLDALRERPDKCMLALLTGNLAKGAELKLTHYGVWDYFEFGAFADDSHDRNKLGSFAQTRARERSGEEFSPDQIYVIGDTPRDVECGKAFGAKTVAIATGNYSGPELSAHEPDFLFEDLSDTEKVLAALFG
ncbi:MAG: HAD family hydrolase [Chthoniobacterales bacterium]